MLDLILAAAIFFFFFLLPQSCHSKIVMSLTKFWHINEDFRFILNGKQSFEQQLRTVWSYVARVLSKLHKSEEVKAEMFPRKKLVLFLAAFLKPAQLEEKPGLVQARECILKIWINQKAVRGFPKACNIPFFPPPDSSDFCPVSPVKYDKQVHLTTSRYSLVNSNRDHFDTSRSSTKT